MTSNSGLQADDLPCHGPQATRDGFHSFGAANILGALHSPWTASVRACILVVAIVLNLPLLMPAQTFAQSDEPAEPTVAQEEPPLPSDLVERERTRLVLLDVVVLDSKDRTVPGLTIDDFELVVDRKPVRPDTLDVACEESLADARNVPWNERRESPPAIPGTKRRIVLVFDYLHLPQEPIGTRAETLDHAMHMLETAELADDEIMVVALTGRVRIEQAFTTDREEIWASLRRMQRDITLWAPAFPHRHVNDPAWVRAMTTLFDVLGTYQGTKAVVLFAAVDPNPWLEGYWNVLAAAGEARCRIYGVDARGLVPARRDIAVSPTARRTTRLGSLVTAPAPRTCDLELLRLASVETGGRMTWNTNDLSMGYARAQRDLTCVYSVGLYDDGEKDVQHEVAVRVRRRGLRAVHPSRYTLQSAEEQKASLLRAAWNAPHLFQTGIVRAHVFPLQPSSKRMWKAMLAVSFPVRLPDTVDQAAVREFGVVLVRQLPRGAERVEDSFSRRVTLRPHAGESGSNRTVTFLRQVQIEPGQYSVTVVVSDPDQALPETIEVEFDVPEIPDEDLFLVGPILGRPAGSDLVVLGGESRNRPHRLGTTSTFEPLLVQQIDEPADLVALTHACRRNSKRGRGQAPPSVVRSLTRVDGEPVGDLPVESLPLDGKERIVCRSLADLLPAAALSDGDFVFDAELRGETEHHVERHGVRFSIGLPEKPLTGNAPH